MKKISEIKKERAKALYDLDMTISKISPESDEVARDVEEKKMEFLIVWRKLQIKKCDEQEFLQASKNLAKVRKIIAPLKSKSEKTCDAFHVGGI